MRGLLGCKGRKLVCFELHHFILFVVELLVEGAAMAGDEVVIVLESADPMRVHWSRTAEL